MPTLLNTLTEPPDADLLADYVRHRSEPAFRQLVERHLGLVRAAARRQLRDEQLADDVAQAVFILLARKARRVANPDLLPAWLLKATWYACRDARKLEARRATHERQAAALRPTSESPPDAEAGSLLPLLDHALARLRDADRAVITLRFLQSRTMTDVGRAVGISEAAAAKRVERAVEKLRAFFARQGVTVSAAALPVVLAAVVAPSATAAPAALVTHVAAAALAHATAAASATSFALAKGAGHLMSLAKLKAVATITAAVAVTAASATVVISHKRAWATAVAPPVFSTPPLTAAPPAPRAGSLRINLPAPAAPPPLATPTAARDRVGGVVRFAGKPPEMPVIDVTGVPDCHKAHGDVTQETVVVGKDAGLANVIVSIIPDEGQNLPGTDKPPREPVVLDQQGCRYVPHVVAIQLGQQVIVKNGDPFLHNVHSQPEKNTPDNRAQPNVDRQGFALRANKEPEYYRVKCDVHPWMSAWVGVVDNPFFAVTDPDGHFVLPKGLPDGTYTLHAWHEKYGEQDGKITVKDGAGEADFTFRPR